MRIPGITCRRRARRRWYSMPSLTCRTEKQIVAAWPDLILERHQFDLVTDLADGIGYLGRAESWVECTAAAEWDTTPGELPATGG